MSNEQEREEIGSKAWDEAVALRAALRRLLITHGTLDEVRRPCGASLSMPHAWALQTLLEQKTMTVKALAKTLNIDRSNVSRLCARMEAQSEILRSRDPNDSRARLISLTPKGRELAQCIEASSTAYFQRVLQQMKGSGPTVVKELEALCEGMELALQREKT